MKVADKIRTHNGLPSCGGTTINETTTPTTLRVMTQVHYACMTRVVLDCKRGWAMHLLSWRLRFCIEFCHFPRDTPIPFTMIVYLITLHTCLPFLPTPE
jgi:hypothetical protein